MTGTISAHPDFDPEDACKRLMKAMKGLGTDEKEITEVLIEHDNSQRQEIKDYYQTAYGKELLKELKSELGGNYETVVLGLMMTPIEWDCYWINRACKGLGTNESVLIEVLVGREYDELDEMKATYKKKYDDQLDKVIDSELSGDICRLVRGIVAAGGEDAGDGEPDEERAQKDAAELQEAAKGMGTDEMPFIAIFNTRSFPQLIATFNAYYELTGKTIEETIKSEFSGNMKEALLAYVQKVVDEPTYFATTLHKAMAGAGTKDNVLIRILVSRSEIDLGDIKEVYEQTYGKSLFSAVKNETSGDYKKLLLQLIGE